MSLTIILLIVNIKYFILINRLTYIIIVLYFIDLSSLIMKLIKRLRYLLFNTNNNLRTLYFIYYFDFALE